MVEIYRRFGRELPKPPEQDGVVEAIIEVFILTCRGRRYEQGMLLPISVQDITAVTSSHHIDLPRWVLDPIIFALDDEVREKANKVKDTK